MRSALNFETIKTVYNKTYWYYDLYHNLGTFNFDKKGRDFLVSKIVKPGNYILDAGGGTGTAAIKAAEISGQNGKVVVLDVSENMLQKAQEKIKEVHFQDRIVTKLGDMYNIPFPDDTFDVVISTYSTCPLENPLNAVKEMFRVLKPNGLLGIAHSSDPNNKIAKAIGDFIESVLWKFPRLSLGCRNIHLIDDIRKMNVTIIEDKIMGFVPWYFRVIIAEKR